MRRVFGRLARQEVPGHEKLLTFELTKAGVVVHRHACRRKGDVTVGFTALAAGGGHRDGDAVFTPTAAGVEVRQPGSLAVTVTWDQLRRIGRRQPELFPELSEKGKA